jgi:hypothetical protein
MKDRNVSLAEESHSSLLGENNMVKNLLVGILVGGLLLLGTADIASADGKGDRSSESRHGDGDGDEDESDGNIRFWDDIWHPGIYYGGYHGGGCGIGGFYGKWRHHRSHRFFGGDDEGDEDNDRIFVLPCRYRSGCGYGAGYGYFGRFGDEGDDGYILGEDGFEPLDHGRLGFYGHERYPYACGGYGSGYGRFGGPRFGYGRFGGPGPYGYGLSSFVANMTSDQEVPALAQALVATGTALVDIDNANGRVCSSLAPSGVGQPIGAHIHRGTAGTSGPVVVDLGMAFRGSQTCVAGDPALLQEIAANPGGFYVNLHTVDFPEGAMRGQLAPRPIT